MIFLPDDPLFHLESLVIIPEWKGLPGNVHAFTTTRNGGVSQFPYGGADNNGGLNLGGHVGDDPSAVKHNRKLISRGLPSSPVFLSQIHGTIVIDAGKAQQLQKADGSFTSQSGLVCCVLTADCLPVLFCNVKGTVVAAAHAGWRGLACGILQATVRQMRASVGDEIIAWLGPAIGPVQFEVGQDVVDAFPHPQAAQYFLKKPNTGKYSADIYSLARLALAEVGVADVYGGHHCTVMESEKFYSYRRDGITGRMASMIWLD
jgi:YfiH family protein